MHTGLLLHDNHLDDTIKFLRCFLEDKHRTTNDILCTHSLHGDDLYVENEESLKQPQLVPTVFSHNTLLETFNKTILTGC